MSIFEIRKGLRRLDFTPNANINEHGTHVVVEFEVGARLARDQVVFINLGLHDGVARELMGPPKLVTTSRGTPPSYTYCLEGDVA